MKYIGQLSDLSKQRNTRYQLITLKKIFYKMCCIQDVIFYNNCVRRFNKLLNILISERHLSHYKFQVYFAQGTLCKVDYYIFCGFYYSLLFNCFFHQIFKTKCIIKNKNITTILKKNKRLCRAVYKQKNDPRQLYTTSPTNPHSYI